MSLRNGSLEKEKLEYPNEKVESSSSVGQDGSLTDTERSALTRKVLLKLDLR